MTTYVPTIGLEIHAELKTKTKLFCDSKNDPHHAEPNTHVCPVCMGHPGTLPVINREAVTHVLKVGKALGGTLATFTEFDRKHYFYPDIPKGYQISQYQYPLVRGGELAGVAITRVHLEEDTARSLHDQNEGSIIDYNRAGVPLLELVTEPVMHDAKLAGTFARELQLLLRTLGVSDANMEKGEMRVEANVSVSQDSNFGTKVEIKNLNSFKAVENAILYEVRRQTELLETGRQIAQETRGWDEAKGKTFAQRAKETTHDYRYFPEPDLPKLDLDVSRIDENMAHLPSFWRKKYSELGLSSEQIEIIISDKRVNEFYAKSVSEADSNSIIAKMLANYLLTDLLPLVTVSKPIHIFNPLNFVKLITLASESVISSRVVKDLLLDSVVKGQDPDVLISTKNLRQSSSDDVLLPLVREIATENNDVVSDFKSGKQAALQYLIGQGMKRSKGAANPRLLGELFTRELLKD